MRTWLLLLGVVLLCAPIESRAEEAEAPSEEEVANAARQAAEASDAKKLAALAAHKDPDPWLVAERLLQDGHEEAAAAFAAASTRPATRGLTAYVRSRAGKQVATASRKALAAARAALDRGDFKRMQEVLQDIPAEDGSAVSAQILFARGIAERSLGQLERAATTLDEAGTAAHEIGWLNLESYVLDWATNVAASRNDRARALQLARARVALERTWGRPKELRASLSDLAVALRRIGEAREARKTVEQAIPIAREHGSTLELCLLLLSACAACMDMDDAAAGLRYAQEAGRLAHADGNARAKISALISVGAVYFDLGELERARSNLERGLKLARRSSLGALEWESLGHLANLYTCTGAYPRALATYDEMVAALKKKPAPRSRAYLLNNMAALHARLGDRPRARTYLREALALFERLQFPPGIGAAASSLADLAMMDDDYDEAATLLERAYECQRGEGHLRHVASTLASMATLASYAGRPGDALDFYRRSLAILDGIGATHVTPSIRANLGYLLIQQGEVEDGVAAMEQAVEEAHALRNPDSHVRVLGLLARNWIEQGQPERAISSALMALDQMEHFLGGLGEEESTATRGVHSRVYEVGGLAAAQIGDAPKALRFLEAGRAGSLLEALGGRDALQWADLPPELLAAEKAARLAQAEAAAGLRAASHAKDMEKQRSAHARLERTTTDLRATIARIQREAKAQAGLYYPRPASLRRIQASLRPGEALVVYGLCMESALAVVVRPKEARLVALGPRAPIEDACAVYRTLTEDVDAGPAEATLKARLVAPLKLPAEVTRVVISPVDALCYVPMSTLFEATVSLTPSATTMALLREETTTRGGPVLALGDPAYGAGPKGHTGVYVRSGLLPLPATRKEVETIGTVVLTGKEATEAGFREALKSRPHWRAVHFACHGRVDHENPTLCALALTPSAEDDGFLSALEVLRLRIPADLAVLSACETGRGRVERGEGLVGLVRAFMHAGTPRVIASLWKVDDGATQALMLKFYELWRGADGKGLDAATALQQAQAFVRSHEKWKHPYFWSAWVLWGSSE